ncbi:uncharacterized protein LOC126842947 [Adelges cooleyi]|uniref:uncharacterized protein LOC126842947 n=1 Tax=Adelges cooleyi TaxID=133065 RepID=UPI00217FC72E|nr:uncharacterized protein LOC126842947 [Adelges cooleyi]XP_050436160.1 uncharacterized protein LOC126842947 [Adelges cooleyi]
MKERYRKQQFLKNLGLRTNKNSNSSGYDDQDETTPTINESECFYYFDDNLQVICRGCFNNFSSWLEYRKHFTPNCCYTTRSEYKMNTYNDVYKIYKLKKAKSKKRINNRLSVAHLMDYETLNTRKTRKRCYANTRVVSNKMGKPVFADSHTTAEEELMKEKFLDSTVANNNGNSSNPVKSVSGYKTETSSDNNNLNNRHLCHRAQDIPKSTKNNSVPNSLKIWSAVQPVKTESNVFVKAQTTGSTSKSAPCNSKNRPAQSNSFHQRHVCVACDKEFLSKTSLATHQVRHVQADRNLFSIFMAGLPHLQRAESS